MKRRDFIKIIAGSATIWPVVARAQQPSGVRRIAVLMAYGEGDPEGKAQFAAFTRGLSELGWTDGRNAQMDVRWAPGNTDLTRTLAKQLVELQPDVILSESTPATAAFKRETPTIPIVFAIVSDPVGSGFVASLPHPGGNITGFSQVQESMTTKWLELLREIAPGVKRVAIMFNPDTAPYISSFYLPSLDAAAQSLGVVAQPAPVHAAPRPWWTRG